MHSDRSIRESPDRVVGMNKRGADIADAGLIMMAMVLAVETDHLQKKGQTQDYDTRVSCPTRGRQKSDAGHVPHNGLVTESIRNGERLSNAMQ